MIRGSHVGVRTRSDATHRACDRCGIVRAINTGRANSGICRDCRQADPDYVAMVEGFVEAMRDA